MKTLESKEKEAIIRMMVYVKFELSRLGLEQEVSLLDSIIRSAEIKLSNGHN